MRFDNSKDKNSKDGNIDVINANALICNHYKIDDVLSKGQSIHRNNCDIICHDYEGYETHVGNSKDNDTNVINGDALICNHYEIEDVLSKGYISDADTNDVIDAELGSKILCNKTSVNNIDTEDNNFEEEDAFGEENWKRKILLMLSLDLNSFTIQ